MARVSTVRWNLKEAYSKRRSRRTETKSGRSPVDNAALDADIRKLFRKGEMYIWRRPLER